MSYFDYFTSKSLFTLTLLAGASLSMAGCIISSGGGDETGTTQGATQGSGTTVTATTGSGPSGSTNSTSSGPGDATGTSGVDLGSCDRSLTPTITAPSRIEQDAVWSGVVQIDGAVQVSKGATLTIQPGTTILAKPGARIEIGYLSETSTLIANGTAEQPIRACGTVPAKGSWGGIGLNPSSTNLSSMAFVSIENAGAAGAAALNLEAQLKLNTVTVRDCAGDGVWATSFGAASSELTVTGCDTPVRLKHADSLSHFPVGGALAGNARDVVAIDFDRIETEVKMHKLSVPYLQLQDLKHTAQANWTIAPGVQYKVSADRKITAGYLSNKTTVNWKGTEQEPIVFSGETPTAGFWKGIWVEDGTVTTSEISGIVIEHAGGSDSSALWIDAPVIVKDIMLQDSIWGLSIGESGLGAGSARVSAKRMAQYPIVVATPALVSTPAGGMFTELAKGAVLVKEGRLNRSGTIPALPIPYRVEGDLLTQGGVELTIAPGVTMEVSADAKIEFGYLGAEDTITAVGTLSTPIVFKGVESTAGFWEGIDVGDSVTSNSKFEFVTVSDGGKGPGALLDLGMPLKVTNSTFKNSAGWGIRRKSDNTVDYVTSNLFENVASGNVGEMQ